MTTAAPTNSHHCYMQQEFILPIAGEDISKNGKFAPFTRAIRYSVSTGFHLPFPPMKGVKIRGPIKVEVTPIEITYDTNEKIFTIITQPLIDNPIFLNEETYEILNKWDKRQEAMETLDKILAVQSFKRNVKTFSEPKRGKFRLDFMPIEYCEPRF